MKHTIHSFHAPLALAAGILTLSISGCDEAPVEDNVLPNYGESRTFYGDIAPILAEACGSCHAAGGIAPMAFDSYEAVVNWAPVIKASVDNRTMPPWNVNNDGECNTYADARWLSDEQIAAIGEWVEAGSPEGDATLGMPAPPKLPALEGADLMTLTGPADYHPATEGLALAAADDYQCFLVDPALTRDQFLVGYDVLPGNAALVHHVIGFNVDLDRTTLIPGEGLTTNRALIEKMDAESPNTPGWDCFGAAGEGVMVEGVPITWAPGAGATHFPDGTGIRIKENQVMVLQIHYNLAEDNGLPDSTQVKLDLVDEVEREAHMVLADGFLMTLLDPEPARLPIGLPDASFEWSMALNEIPSYDLSFLGEIEVLGVLPHMHGRGRTMSIEFGNDDGGPSCGAKVDNWNYQWQQAFFLDQPVRMNIADEMHVRCTFDTRTAEEPVGPGFGTGDEMCLAGVYVAAVK